jgi:uncharacterized LabA/DUF88 family protein
MNYTVLFVDGENFIHKVKNVLKREKITKVKLDPSTISLHEMFEPALSGFKVSEMIYYAARLHEHNETLQKSKELIKFQRNLKTNLEKQGFKFKIAGNVRAQQVRDGKDKKIIFREKGVDVKIAVDLVAGACDGKLKTAIICSSDSDLQPAIPELKRRDVEIVYLGFEINPNRGLIFTSDRNILIRNSEVISALKG